MVLFVLDYGDEMLHQLQVGWRCSSRSLNYEQIQLDLERKSETNLSPVDSILAEIDSAKRADILSERVRILVASSLG